MGRTTEVHEFLESLEQQKVDDIELIVIDQNKDDRLLPILAAYPRPEVVRHVRAEPGVSRARNLGKRLATGEIIIFPDDDCWYPPDLLNQIDAWFRANPTYGIVTTTVRDRDGSLSANKWKAETCDLAPINIFRTTACYTIFTRRTPAVDGVFFDELLGPSCPTRFGAAEDTDFVLSMMKAGVKGAFTSRLYVGHPKRDMYSGHVKVDRALSYGLGMGRVLRKHGLHLLSAALFGFDFVRTAKSVFSLDFRSAKLCWAHGRGILEGFLAKP